MLNKKGFTLIEVLIASAIFIMFSGAMIGLFNLTSKSGLINKHRLEATNLAREGIELVTQIKQTASTRGKDWESGCWNINNGDKFLSMGATDTDCENTWRLENGVNDTIALTDTIPYTRVINIADENGAKKITVTVSWDDYGQPHSAVETTYLTNWQ